MSTTISSKTVMSLEEYEAKRREAMSQSSAGIDDAARNFADAHHRYQQSLRAFPPSYYELKPVAGTAAAAEGHPAVGAAAQPATDELTDHNYDGIQEYDNPTPGWWYALFAATVVFSVGYLFIYHMSSIVPPLSERHARAEAKLLNLRYAELNDLPLGEEKIYKIMSQPAWLAQGEAVFQQTCAICHSNDGSGMIGPNLTDHLYVNVQSVMDIPKLVTEGTPSRAMPPQLLNENEVALVSAYVVSLRGQNLPTNDLVIPDYMGEEIAPWPIPQLDGALRPAAPTQDRAMK